METEVICLVEGPMAVKSWGSSFFNLPLQQRAHMGCLGQKVRRCVKGLGWNGVSPSTTCNR